MASITTKISQADYQNYFLNTNVAKDLSGAYSNVFNAIFQNIKTIQNNILFDVQTGLISNAATTTQRKVAN